MEGPSGYLMSPTVPGITPTSLDLFKNFLSTSPSLDSFLTYNDLLDLIEYSETTVKA